MTKYFCDKCGKQAFSTKDLNEVSIRLKPGIKKQHENVETNEYKVLSEICEECLLGLKAFLRKE